MEKNDYLACARISFNLNLHMVLVSTNSFLKTPIKMFFFLISSSNAHLHNISFQ